MTNAAGPTSAKHGPVRQLGQSLLRLAYRAGVPSHVAGFRAMREASLADAAAAEGKPCLTIHPAEVKSSPLPQNIADRQALPDDAGWWGYSFRDVPERPAGPTQIAELHDATVAWYFDPQRQNDFYPTIITRRGLALRERELRLRPPHHAVLRSGTSPQRLDEAAWFLERVYDNHSHWWTAHLPKLLLLQQQNRLRHVLIPRDLPATLEDSLRLLNLPDDAFIRFDPDRPLRVGRLTVLATDRFRPELLNLVPERLHLSAAMQPRPHRRIYISRARASRRRLLTERNLEPLLSAHGFEIVFMEEHSLPAQAALMREAAVVAGPHGAGLTNMLMCPTGADVVEIADPGFPNPNFYALASALGHRYWFVAADSVGHGHPLKRDLEVDAQALGGVLARLPDCGVAGALR